MTGPAIIRGRPIVALVLILGGWIAGRAMLWDDAAWPRFRPPAAPILAGFDASLTPFPVDKVFARGERDESDAAAVRVVEERASSARSLRGIDDGWDGGWHDAPAFRRPAGIRPPPIGLFSAAAGDPLASYFAVNSARSWSARDTAAHQMLWMAAQSGLPLPIAVATGGRQAEAGPFAAPPSAEVRHDRWSADTWVLLRRGGNASLATGAAPATYGASQAGAVLRYSLAPKNTHRPAAYLRTTAALNGSDERDVALGLSARPLGGVPIRAAAEVRATRQAGGTHFRPAAMVITELAPFRLPFEARALAYGQAGYVGGEFSTAFADGQITVDRGIVTVAGNELRAGGGIWGGVQKGASRLDAGPTASMGMRIGDNVSARVAADWRFRVTGNAEPSSGPALTLSAGF